MTVLDLLVRNDNKKLLSSYVNQAKLIPPCVPLAERKKGRISEEKRESVLGAWMKTTGRGKGEKRRGGRREKEEGKKRRIEKTGTPSWRPHVMRFSFFYLHGYQEPSHCL